MPTSTKLSGGEKRRVALCQLLLRQPDLLLLDEPTNHLDAETVRGWRSICANIPGAVLIVTHDRYFLDNVTGWILELDRGRGIPYEGNYSAYLEKKAKRMAQEGREEAARQRALDARARVDRRQPARPPGQIEGAHPGLRRAAQAQRGARAGHRADHHPARRAARRQRHRRRAACRRAMATGC